VVLIDLEGMLSVELSRSSSHRVRHGVAVADHDPYPHVDATDAATTAQRPEPVVRPYVVERKNKEGR
jgi:hypothetical protein